jgi:hypothetical protein
MKITTIIASLSNSRALWPLKIAVTVLVVYLVDKSLPKNELPRLIHSMAIGPLSIGLVLGFAGLFLQTKRWQLLLKNQGMLVDFKTAVRTILWGNLLAFVTPGRSGDFLRGISIDPRNKADTVYAVLIEKIHAAGAALVAGAFAAIVFCLHRAAWPIAERSVIVVCAACIGLLAMATFTRKTFKPAFFGFFRQRFFKKFPTFPLANFTKKATVHIALFSMTAHVVLLTQTAVLLDMFGGGGFWTALGVAAQSYAFMLFFPIFIANMGIREYSFGLFLERWRIGYGAARISSIALGASLGILCINIAFPALAGLLWWICGKTMVKKNG